MVYIASTTPMGNYIFIHLMLKEKLPVLFVLFYTNGQKESEAMMLKNKKEGKFTAWYEEGNKRKEAKYKGGKLDGRIVKYYPNGDTASIEHIKNDVREGEYKIWDLTLRTLIKAGKLLQGKKEWKQHYIWTDWRYCAHANL